MSIFDQSLEALGARGRSTAAVAPGIPVPVAIGRQMKRRHPWLVWALSLLTFGVYFFIWWFKIHTELRRFDARQRIRPLTSLVAVLFGIVLLLPPLYSTAAIGDRIARAQIGAGRTPTCSGVVGLLLFFALGLHIVYYQTELNKIIDAYPTSPPNSRVALIA